MTSDFEIRHSSHYEENRVSRSLPEGCGDEVLQDAEAHYYDTNGKMVAVKRMNVLGADRDVAVVYEIQADIRWFVTIFPLKDGQQQNRLKNGRWVLWDEPESEL